MDVLNIVDNSLLFALLLLIIIVYILARRTMLSQSEKYLVYLCASTVAVLVLDTVAWLVDGLPGIPGKWLSWWSNSLFLLLYELPFAAWLLYLDYQITRKVRPPAVRVLFHAHFFVALIMMILNTFSGFVFTIDGGNWYHRGPGFYLISGVNYMILVATLILVSINRRNITQKLFYIATLFCILPIVGSLFQVFFYGVATTWPLFAMMIVLVYFFLEIQANIRDHLTGLLNRRQIEEILQARIASYDRCGSFALVMVDMNDFKSINDTFGHQAGDSALVDVSSLLFRSIKNTDRLGRLGGDEFLILLETADDAEIRKVMSRIRENLDSMNEKKNAGTDSRQKPHWMLSLSMGHAIFNPAIHRDYNALMNDADREMYRDKETYHRSPAGRI